MILCEVYFDTCRIYKREHNGHVRRSSLFRLHADARAAASRDGAFIRSDAVGSLSEGERPHRVLCASSRLSRVFQVVRGRRIVASREEISRVQSKDLFGSLSDRRAERGLPRKSRRKGRQRTFHISRLRLIRLYRRDTRYADRGRASVRGDRDSL